MEVVRREFSAGGVIVRRMRGRWWLAAIRPRRDRDAPDVWMLPKGLIEPGERGADAAVREAYEETGLRTQVGAKLGDVRYVYTWQGERVFKIVSFFLLRPVGGRLGLLLPGMEREVEEARWLPLQEAGRRLTYSGEREIAGQAMDALLRRDSVVEPL